MHLKNQSQTLNILIQSEFMYTQKEKHGPQSINWTKDDKAKVNIFNQ